MTERGPGTYMELYVPHKNLAAVARAIKGVPMEHIETPNWGSYVDPRIDEHRLGIEENFPVRERGNVAFIILRESGGNAGVGCKDCFMVRWTNGKPDYSTVTRRLDMTAVPELPWKIIEEDSQGLLQINANAWTGHGNLKDPVINLRVGRLIFNDGLARFGDVYHHWRSRDPRVTTPRQVI